MDLEAFVGTGLQINDQTAGRALPLSHQERWSGSEISHAATPNAATVAPYRLRFEASVHFKTHYDEADWLLALSSLFCQLVFLLVGWKSCVGRPQIRRAGARWRQGPACKTGSAPAFVVRWHTKNRKTPATMSKRAQDTGDASSLSDPNAATFTHLSVVWDVNFDSQQIAATAEYDVKVSTKGADLFLDTKSLAIQEIVVDGTVVADWTLEDGIEVSYAPYYN